MTAAILDVAAVLSQALPATWLVHTDARTLDHVAAQTIVVWPSTVTRIEMSGLSWLRCTHDLWVITSTTRPDAVETVLQTSLLEVLDVIESRPELTWTTADRGVLADTHHGWHVQLSHLYRIGS